MRNTKELDVTSSNIPHNDDHIHPRRIWIVGVSGAGKTTLARKVAHQLEVAHLELDAVFWQEHWTFRDLDEAHASIRAFQAAHSHGWVMDGNWTSRLNGMLTPGTPGGADVVVWLDHPRLLTMWRVITRTLKRGITQEPLWHGNTERVRGWLSTDPNHNIVLFAWRQHSALRARWKHQAHSSPHVVRLRGRAHVSRWLSTLTPPSTHGHDHRREDT